MAFIDLIKNVPDIGKETLEFILKPKLSITNRGNSSKKYVSVKKTFLWLLAVSILLFKIYSSVFNPITEDVLSASPFQVELNKETSIEIKSTDTLKPTIEKIVWWSPGFGVGINFDPTKPSNLPQDCVFHVGGLYALVKNIKPEQFGNTGFSAFILITLAIVLAMCLFISMKILKTKTGFKEVFNYSLLYISSYCFAASLLAVLTAAICIHFIGIKGWTFYWIWIIIVLLPLLFLSVRGYFLGFSALFNVRKRKLLLGGIISCFMSWLVSPIVFAPLLYVSIWLIPIYDYLI